MDKYTKIKSTKTRLPPPYMLLEFTFAPILNIGSKVSLNKFKIDPIKFYRINWSDLSSGVDRILLKTSRSLKKRLLFVDMSANLKLPRPCRPLWTFCRWRKSVFIFAVFLVTMGLSWCCYNYNLLLLYREVLGRQNTF